MASQPTPAQLQETRKRLALSIIDFLNSSLEDGALAAEDRDSIDVATNCIADAFKVDAADVTSRPTAPQDKLLSIYTVYERLRGKTGGGAGAASTSTAAGSSSASAASASSGPSADQLKEAEALKSRGNAALQKKNHAEAIDLYTQAIALNPSSAIYLSNRAAAYSAQGKHDLARADAEMAVAADPKYTKGWSRLGLARFALGDAKGSMEAYQSGIDAEGSGGSDAMRKGFETAKRKVEEQGGDTANARDRNASPTGGLAGGDAGGMPDLASLANMFGGGAGGGGGGGMPDLGALLQNPMMRQMAERVMANPEMMNNLMSNPQVQQMANQFSAGGGPGQGAGAGGAGGGGGGMPDLNALMSDPNIAEMARNMMGGGGAGAGRGGGGAGR